jgi:hypothetical protein
MTEGETRGAIFTRGAIDETTVRIVDALFRHFAKQVSPKKGISIEDAIDASLAPARARVSTARQRR